MSLHTSVVSIEGDHLQEIADVLRKSGYVIQESFTVHSGDQASLELNWNPARNRVAKVAYSSEGWTHIVDPEMVLMIDDVWLEFSGKWNNVILGWICEGASGSYGLWVFQSGRKRREVLAVDGVIALDSGEPLDEESDVTWSVVFEDDVLLIAERLGAQYDFLADRTYLVYRLDESGIAPS